MTLENLPTWMKAYFKPKYNHVITCNTMGRTPKWEPGTGCSCPKPGGQGRSYMSLREALRLFR